MTFGRVRGNIPCKGASSRAQPTHPGREPPEAAGIAAREVSVRSTMMDVPLTLGWLMRYGTSVYGEHEVVTATEDGTRRRSYAEVGRRAAQLAGALRRLGVDGDQRVGTLMWNNA